MKRKLALLAISILLVMSTQTLAGFQESRWQIMDLLAYPEKIEKTMTEVYSVNKADWERSDLKDGTPRWLAQARELYNYELIGTPIKSATMTGMITEDTNQVYQLMIRSALLMRAMGMSKEVAAEAFETLVNSATKDKDSKYYVKREGVRVEMTVFSAMSMLMITLLKA